MRQQKLWIHLPRCIYAWCECVCWSPDISCRTLLHEHFQKRQIAIVAVTRPFLFFAPFSHRAELQNAEEDERASTMQSEEALCAANTEWKRNFADKTKLHFPIRMTSTAKKNYGENSCFEMFIFPFICAQLQTCCVRCCVCVFSYWQQRRAGILPFIECSARLPH